MKISICGKLPKAFSLSRKELKSAAKLFATLSSKRVGGYWHEVVVYLGDDRESDEMHQAIMNIAGATDVITQAYDAIPPEKPGIFGELFVNTDQALREAAKRKKQSPKKELLLYVAHGMDHLSGADDHSEKGYLAMRRRELNWIKKWFEEEGNAE